MSRCGSTIHCARGWVMVLGGGLLIGSAVALPVLVPGGFERLRWEALRQLACVFPGTLLLAWGLATLKPRIDPLVWLSGLRRGMLLALCAVLVVAGSWFSSSFLLRGGPFVPGDEDEYLFQARIFARGRLWWDTPAHPEFFVAPGQLVSEGRLFGHHQCGHSALLAVGVVFGHPRAVPIVLAMLSIPVCYALGRTVGGPEGGRLSVLLLALSPLFWFTMGSLVSEASSMFLLLSMTCLLLSGRGQRWAAVAAGCCLGMAAATRVLSAITVGVPIVAWWMRKHRLRDAVSLAAGALPFAIVIGTVNCLLTGSALRFPFAAYEPQPLGFDEVYRLATGMRNLASNALLLNFWLLGWPLGLGVVGASLWLLRRRGEVLVLALASGALGVGYVLYWHRGQVATGPLRFFEACPLLVCVAAAGLAHARGRGGRVRSAVGWAVLVAVVASLLTFVPGRAAVLREFTAGVQEPVRVVEKAGLQRALVFLKAEDYLFSYPRNDLEFRHPHDVIFARDLGSRNNELIASHPGYVVYLLHRDGQGRWRLHGPTEHGQ